MGFILRHPHKPPMWHGAGGIHLTSLLISMWRYLHVSLVRLDALRVSGRKDIIQLPTQECLFWMSGTGRMNCAPEELSPNWLQRVQSPKISVLWSDESHLQSLCTSVPHLWDGDNDISILLSFALFALLNCKVLKDLSGIHLAGSRQLRLGCLLNRYFYDAIDLFQNSKSETDLRNAS